MRSRSEIALSGSLIRSFETISGLSLIDRQGATLKWKVAPCFAYLLSCNMHR